MSAGWRRTYWVVFLSNLVTAVGMMSFLPFFPSVLREMGLEDQGEIELWTGVIFGAAPFSAAFMGPIWGSIGDRFGRKLMVVRSLLAITLFVGLMGFATTPLTLLLLRLGQGVFSGFVPPSITLVSVAAPEEAQGRVAGSLQAALWAGSILGPLAGAWVQAALGLRSVFLFVSLASGLAALLVLLYAGEERELKPTLERFSPTSALRGLGSDLLAVLRLRDVRLAIGLLFFVQFGLGATNPLLELFVAQTVGGSPEEVRSTTALLFTAIAASALVASPTWGWVGDRLGHGRTLLITTLVSAVALLFHGLAAGLVGLYLARVLLGVASSGMNTAAFAVASAGTRTSERGSAMGSVFSARALAVSTGAMVGGALSAVLGLRGLYLAAGGVVVLAAGYALATRSRGARAARGASAADDQGRASERSPGRASG